MRQALIPLVIFVLLLSVLPASAAPQVSTPQREFDFGRIFHGEKVHHTFEFANSGDAPLNVSKVRTSCGCTAALVSSRLLEPDEKGEINVTFDSTRFDGDIKKKIYLYTNDPQQAITTFIIKGTIDQEIAYQPKRLTLGPVAPEDTVRGEISLVNQGEKNIRFEIARVSLAEMTAQLEKTDLPPSGSTLLQVEVTPKKGQERLNGWVILETDSSSTPRLRIPVLVEVE